MHCMSMPLPIFKENLDDSRHAPGPWTVFPIFSQLIGLTPMFIFQMGKPRSKEINTS